MKVVLKVVAPIGTIFLCASSAHAMQAPAIPIALSPVIMRFNKELAFERDQLGAVLFRAVNTSTQEHVKRLLSDERFKSVVNWRTPATCQSRDEVGGQTALIRASAQGKKQIVELLIKAGAAAEIKDQQGKDALTYAVDLDNLDVASYLLSVAKVCPNDCSDSLLVKATLNKNKSMTTILLNAGADPRGSQIYTGTTAVKTTKENDWDLEVAMIDQKIKNAQQKAEAKSSQKTLKPKAIDELPEYLKKLLFSCLSYKNPTKIAQTFFTFALIKPKFLKDMRDTKNLMALFEALPNKHNRLALAKYFQDELYGGKIPFMPLFTTSQIEECKVKFQPLFAHNTPMGVWLKKTKDHLKPCVQKVDDIEKIPQDFLEVGMQLIIATQENDPAKVHTILNDKYINFGSEQARAALISAIRNNNLKIASMLLHAGVDPDLIFCPINEIKTGAQLLQTCTPAMIQLILGFAANPSYILPFAIAAENKEIALALLKAGANDQGTGETPLMQAARVGDARKITFILNLGIDPAAINPRDKMTARDYAQQKGHTGIVALLDKHKSKSGVSSSQLQSNQSQ